MWIRTLRWSLMVLIASAVVWTAGRAWGIGFVPGQTKEDLKLKYDVVVEEHYTDRITFVLTLADEGRLKPLDEVELAIPCQEKNADGSHWMDLVVAIDLKKTDDGKRVSRVHIRRELAERAEIWLNTHSLDGKPDPLTRLHHVIPVAKYLKNAPAEAAKPNAAPAAVAPPATEQKKD